MSRCLPRSSMAGPRAQAIELRGAAQGIESTPYGTFFHDENAYLVLAVIVLQGSHAGSAQREWKHRLEVEMPAVL